MPNKWSPSTGIDSYSDDPTIKRIRSLKRDLHKLCKVFAKESSKAPSVKHLQIVYYRRLAPQFFEIMFQYEIEPNVWETKECNSPFLFFSFNSSYRTCSSRFKPSPSLDLSSWYSRNCSTLKRSS